MFQMEVVEKIKIHILCSLFFFFGLTVFSIRFECYANWADAYKESLFFPENRTVYEVEWKNTVKKGRPQMAV